MEKKQIIEVFEKAVKEGNLNYTKMTNTATVAVKGENGIELSCHSDDIRNADLKLKYDENQGEPRFLIYERVQGFEFEVIGVIDEEEGRYYEF